MSAEQTTYRSAPSGGQVPCSYHPKVMTGLRCSRCGKPICPQCAVRTPVGLRCPDCAGVRGLPTYRTDSMDLLKAIGAGLLVAIVVAIAWRFGPQWGFYLNLILGFGVAEAMAHLARQKRGIDLQVAAMAIVAFGLVLSRVLLAQRFGVTLGDLNSLNAYVFTPEVRAAYRFPQPATFLLRVQFLPDLVYMIMPLAIAWIRFR